MMADMDISNVILFEAAESEGFFRLRFELTDAIRPEDLDSIKDYLDNSETSLSAIQGNKGLVISGRGPIWLYAFLSHYYGHRVLWLGVFDPKQEGAVVVQSHEPGRKEGDIVPCEE